MIEIIIWLLKECFLSMYNDQQKEGFLLDPDVVVRIFL